MNSKQQIAALPNGKDKYVVLRKEKWISCKRGQG